MRRKIVIACDSFKGSLTSREAGTAAAEGVRSVFPECDVQVVAVGDGGEGTLSAIITETGGTIIRREVQGPLGAKVNAAYGICGSLAVIEMAEASGLNLIAPKERDPLRASSFGTGELIAEAIKAGCRNFLIGLGGSATNDGGTGMLRALGYRFIDSSGNEITDEITRLTHLAKIDSSNVIPQLRECRFTAMCDVDTPLTGEEGASRVFGPQKGADREMIEILDSALVRFARITERNCGYDLSAYPGSGAAGGTGFALLAFLNARMKSGIDVVLDTIGFDRKIADTSLIITGEGRIDRQTAKGKTPFGILRRALKSNIPVIAIGGSVDQKAIPELLNCGFKDIIGITPAEMPLGEAMKPDTAKENIRSFIVAYLNSLSIRL